jgi:phosphoribosylanthranilate isomerase
MRIKVKICGITNIDDALLSIELGADMLGFIFYPKSKRYISFDRAQKIISQIPSSIDKIGVFVDHGLKELKSTINIVGLTSVQLHGNENQDYINKIPLPVIKGLRIKPNFDFASLNRFNNCIFLLDAYSETELGGTGKSFNWDIIPGEIRKYIILAGGISTNNIEYIYKNIKPKAIDLSSSLESSPGIKDPHKLKAFFNKINQLEKTIKNE